MDTATKALVVSSLTATIGAIKWLRELDRPKADVTVNYLDIGEGMVRYAITIVATGNKPITVKEIAYFSMPDTTSELSAATPLTNREIVRLSKGQGSGFDVIYEIGKSEQVFTIQPNCGIVHKFEVPADTPQPVKAAVTIHARYWRLGWKYRTFTAEVDSLAVDKRMFLKCQLHMLETHVSGWRFREVKGGHLVAIRASDGAKVDMDIIGVLSDRPLIFKAKDEASRELAIKVRDYDTMLYEHQKTDRGMIESISYTDYGKKMVSFVPQFYDSLVKYGSIR